MLTVMDRAMVSWLLLLVVAVVGCTPTGRPSTPAPLAGPYDIVIEGGREVDGSGNPWFHGDLAITGDRIDRITPAG
jgi:dihydroorotase/N-acyl-D-amino-acid deacylase